MDGFVKLHRKIIDWKWFKDGNTLKVFIYLLSRASFKGVADGLGNKLKRGQLSTSLRNIATDCRLSPKQVRTSIKKLKNGKEIGTQTNNKCTIITINNWDEYQIEGKQEGNQRASKGHNKKKDKKEKNVYNTLEEKINFGKLYIDAYSHRFADKYILSGADYSSIKNLQKVFKENDWHEDKFQDIVKTYFNQPNSFYSKASFPLHLLERNINKFINKPSKQATFTPTPIPDRPKYGRWDKQDEIILPGEKKEKSHDTGVSEQDWLEV